MPTLVDEERRRRIMRILAALLIDAENISPRHATCVHQILARETQHGVSLVARVLIGNTQALAAWSLASHGSHFETRTHQGGRNAADRLLRDEAFSLAGQGVEHFYLVSNDGGFTAIASMLQLAGRQVIGLGTLQAAKQWKDRCDRFFLLGTHPAQVGGAPAQTLEKALRVSRQIQGERMESFSSLDGLSFPDAEKTREALRTIYGAATLPPLFTRLLFLLLQHTFTALCLTEQEAHCVEQWSASWDVEVLTTSLRDPVINEILEQESDLRTTWQALTAFAHRCRDAYEQGRTAARQAFPHLPRARGSVLSQEHLASLQATFHYRAMPEEASSAYPGYTPEAEHQILLRWFRRGYLAGAQEEAEEVAQKTPVVR
jgi:hypothetical protein